MFRYPARLITDGKSITVQFRDIPEALTCGVNRENAMDMAADALLVAMDFYFADKRPVPIPSAPERSEVLIDLPTSISTKVLLLNAMLDQGVTPAELARRLGTRRQDIHRLIDLSHATKIDTIAAALLTLDLRMKISVAPA